MDNRSGCSIRKCQVECGLNFSRYSYTILTMIEIVKVLPSEINTVMALVQDAIGEMEKEGIYQWDNVYPDKTVFIADITAKQLYCVKSDGLITGIMAVNEDQFPAYQNISGTIMAGL